MASNEQIYLPIGKVKKTFGAHGELLLAMYGERRPPQPKTPVFISIDGLYVPFYIGFISIKGNRVVVQFDDVETEAQAAELVGAEFCTEAHSAATKPNSDGTYDDYENFTFADSRHGIIGKFSYRLDYPGNPIIVLITSQGKEVLVPDNAALVASVDKKAKFITLNLPEGLLEMNE